jgi:fructoselysine 6-kinase
MTRILGLGDNTVDTYVDAGLQYPGGNAVNVAVMTARLGATTAYLGCTGNDEGGELVRSALHAESVETMRVRVREGANARAFIGHVDGDRRFLRTEDGVRADYRWDDADFKYIADFDHVHSSIYSQLGAALPLVATSARSLSFDYSNRWSHDYLAETLPHVAVAFLSASELTVIEVDELLRTCLDHGVRTVVVTRGSDGAVGANHVERFAQPALPAEVVDTLGAGDGFISGFLTAALAGVGLRESLLAGAEYAAQVCGWQGGFGYAAPWHEGEIGSTHVKGDHA